MILAASAFGTFISAMLGFSLGLGIVMGLVRLWEKYLA